MLEIDGGDGGGQLLRTALTLAMCAGEPVAVENVRGNRPEPGLKPQHLAAVETAAAVCDAEVTGVELGSERVSFDPGKPTGGRYEAEIGTAGSLTLLFDTLLPVATRLDEPLRLTATGGTDVKWSPPMVYYRHVKLPLLARLGLAATVERERVGFYPVGGGSATLYCWPSEVVPVELTERGTVERARVYSLASTRLADAEVAERQADAVADGLPDGVETVERSVTYAEAASPGSVVLVRFDGEQVLAGFDAYGERGTPAERVGERAATAATNYLDGSGAVDPHMADQLLVFLAVAGGSVRIPRVTDHVESSLDLLERFGYRVDLTEGDDEAVVLSVPSTRVAGNG
jgi:RNA 3'-terminal phosphate cyclase (ATP)